MSPHRKTNEARSHNGNHLARLSLCSLCLLVVPFPFYGQDTAAPDLIRMGAQQMQEGHYPDAEKYFRSAIQASPQFAEAHLDLGLALIREGSIQDAVQELESAAHLDPQLRGVHMFLGISYYQMHRLSDSIAALQQEVVLNDQSAEAQMWLGIAQMAAGNAAGAIAPLDRAAELSPKDLNILDYRGQAHGLVARDSYAQMYKLAPKSWHVHRLQAELYAAQDRHREAIPEYLEAIRLDPKNADLYERLGEEYRTTSQLDLAHDAYEKELHLSPGNGIAMYNLGSIDVEKDDAKEGVPLLEEVAGFYAQAPVVKYFLGRGLAELGRDEEAIRLLEYVVKATPSGEIAKRSYFELSRIYRKIKQPEKAQEALAQYLKTKQQMESEYSARVEDWMKLNEAASSDAPEVQP